VVVYLFNQPDYLLFASVLPDCEEHVFETIVKSKFSAIGRTLAREASVGRDSAGPATTSQRTGQPSTRAIEVLIQACNAISQVMGGKISRAKVASAWRHARDDAAMANEEMTALEVNADGKLNLRKGRVIAASVANVRSFAGIAHSFFAVLETAGAEAEEAFYSLIEPHRGMLEEHGFYMFLREIAGRTSRTHQRQVPASR
jgi:hypothetical protein